MNKKIKITFFMVLFYLVLSFIHSYTINALEYDFSFEIIQDENTNQISINMSSPYGVDIDNDGVNELDVLDERVARGVVWNKFLNKYKVLIVGFTGVATITLIGFAMFSFTKLSACADNPQKKQEAIMHIGVIIAAAMILGTVTLIFGYAYNVFR